MTETDQGGTAHVGGRGGKGQTKMLGEEREMENDACVRGSEGPNTGQ